MSDTERDRRGTVFLVEEDLDEDGAGGGGERLWDGHWDASPDGRGLVEQMGYVATLDEALAWGRARAPRVLVRYHQAGAYLWAGDGPPLPGLLPLEDPDDDNHDA
jgi:hypothetical protein